MGDAPLLPVGPGHRERLLAGLAESIRVRGFRATKITDVVAAARTSRRSFYEQFEDREACYLALFDLAHELIVEHVAAAVDPALAWDVQVDQAVGAYFDVTADEPELTVSFIRELPGLGEVGAARQRDGIVSFAQLLVRLVDTDSMRRAGVAPVSMETAILFVGGLRELIAYTLEDERELAAARRVACDLIKGVLDPAGARSSAPAAR
jgi:AcrR family transcriptional regulator